MANYFNAGVVPKDDLKKENYNTVIINLSNPDISDKFNPISLPEKLYKEGKKDAATDILEDIGNYIFCSDTYNPSVDPFWKNSATSLFIGLTLYLFENNKDNVTLSDISELVNDFEKIEEYFKSVSRSTKVSMYLQGTVLAPKETKGSIISVFSQSIRLFTTRESLSKLMENTSFELETIQKDKTALFIIPDAKSYARRLVPIIIDECYNAVTTSSDNKRRLNILIDEFESIIRMNDFINMLSLARSYNIRFNIYIKSFLELENTYGKETYELLKITFSNIIYLLANDINTLEEISRMCGNKKEKDNIVPLVTPEELKLLDKFEAIILMPRINPIRTKLVPDYEINW
jgi:type IV secretion system protein VirD4